MKSLINQDVLIGRLLDAIIRNNIIVNSTSNYILKYLGSIKNYWRCHFPAQSLRSCLILEITQEYVHLVTVTK